MDASWPGLCFILFFFSLRSQKEEAARGQPGGRGWNLTHVSLDIGDNMGALGSASLRLCASEGKLSVSGLCFLSLLGNCLTSLCP